MTENLEAGWFDPEQTTFGDRLAGARELAGMSQEQLAARLGVKLSTLRKWEDDVSEPRVNRLSMLSGLLNVSFRWLLNGEGEGMPTPAGGSDSAEIVRDVQEMRQIAVMLAERLAKVEARLREAGAA